jgi:hypothetical protein
VKEAWDAVKILRIDDERTRDASTQQLRREIGILSFKEGESVTEFGIRITTLATNVCTLGDNITDAEVVKKLLRVVPEWLAQAVVSLEMFLDLNKVKIEEVIGRLRVFEERANPAQIMDAMGRLMLCEEDWETRRKEHREQENSGGGSSSSNRGKRQDHARRRGSTSRNGRDGKNMAAGNDGGGKPPPGTLCHNCGKGGHWAKECHGKKKNVTHVGEAQEEEWALMYVVAETEVIAPPRSCPPSMSASSTSSPQAPIHIHERKVLLHLSSEEEKEVVAPCQWVLDTGATNHMTGSRRLFAELDTSVTGTVRFGDRSVVDIEGKDIILFALKSGEHRWLDGVYYIPWLTTNIVSLGQMDEEGLKVVIEEGILRLFDLQRQLAKVLRSPSRFYLLDMNIAALVCLTARVGDVAWSWHERYGHVNFQALRKLGHGGMVRGLPAIDHVDQVCEDCVLAKQKRKSFPKAAKY